MTRSEQFRKSRAWLKMHRFVITNSLWEKVKALPLEEREGYCYVQNLVLMTADEYDDGKLTPIGTTAWGQRLGSNYKRFILQLEDWNELECDWDFSWSRDKSGSTMSYAVPPAARDSGTIIVEFERERIRLPRPKNRPQGEVSQYALECLMKLTVAKVLVYPPPKDPRKDPAKRQARIRNHCEHIAGGDFSLGYGKKVKRLYHRVLSMPREGRCNLTYHCPLAEYDVRTCHPFLMLSLFTVPAERSLYAEMLKGDIYRRIKDEMGIDDREQVKDDFQRVVNFGHKTPAWMAKQYVFQFYHAHFPNFAEQVLFARNDLARHLQNYEASLMVQKLGRYCLEKSLFWIPMHDGYISSLHTGQAIAAQASNIIEEAVGLVPQITCKEIVAVFP